MRELTMKRKMTEQEEKRQKNNESVQRCRLKKKNEKEEKAARIKQLKEENSQLDRDIEVLQQQLEFLTNVMEAHKQAEGNNASEAFQEWCKLF